MGASCSARGERPVAQSADCPWAARPARSADRPPRPQEYECLEQENAALRREIGKLRDELRHLSEALREHEKMCPLLLCPLNCVPAPRPDPAAGCLPR
ncbi:Basic leucine zipper transcriptional factor ATF-like 3 [Galemys pyrenaicus]|uniref:Basic leucine zipper transcriptional factor ATF-like 3 n=1 Tax=Galemys pyrenaicus TaxID=202257 RepID=A0A8J6A388_GALPY|nr:Basic leucine zipper transcriptional factor ATF-like 3 [Galemys pyrenaicus]